MSNHLWKARCTVTTEFNFCETSTQNAFCWEYVILRVKKNWKLPDDWRDYSAFVAAIQNLENFTDTY